MLLFQTHAIVSVCCILYLCYSLCLNGLLSFLYTDMLKIKNIKIKMYKYFLLLPMLEVVSTTYFSETPICLLKMVSTGCFSYTPMLTLAVWAFLLHIHVDNVLGVFILHIYATGWFSYTPMLTLAVGCFSYTHTGARARAYAKTKERKKEKGEISRPHKHA